MNQFLKLTGLAVLEAKQVIVNTTMELDAELVKCAVDIFSVKTRVDFGYLTLDYSQHLSTCRRALIGQRVRLTFEVRLLLLDLKNMLDAIQDDCE